MKVRRATLGGIVRKMAVRRRAVRGTTVSWEDSQRGWRLERGQ